MKQTWHNLSAPSEFLTSTVRSTTNNRPTMPDVNGITIPNIQIVLQPKLKSCLNENLHSLSRPFSIRKWNCNSYPNIHSPLFLIPAWRHKNRNSATNFTYLLTSFNHTIKWPGKRKRAQQLWQPTYNSQRFSANLGSSFSKFKIKENPQNLTIQQKTRLLTYVNVFCLSELSK